MKLKIISNGTVAGTKLVDELGNMVDHVQSISWSIRIGELSRATIELINIPIETGQDGQEHHRKPRKRYIRCLGDAVVEAAEEPASVPELMKYVKGKFQDSCNYTISEGEG